jgi:ABC-type transport system involved in multi-copper enzyme maturation permease subunit
MTKAWVIALNTFREALRGKTLYVLIIVAFVAMASCKLFSFFTPEEELKMIKDIGFSSIELFGALIAIFTAIKAISGEIEKKTIYTLLSKPVSRKTIYIGKFIGQNLILLLIFLLMSTLFTILLIFKRNIPGIPVFKTLLLIYIELILIGSISLALSCFSTDVFNVIFSIFLFITGHLTSYFSHLIEKTENVSTVQ